MNGGSDDDDFGDIDGRFEFFAVVTPNGRTIPTVDDDAKLTDPAVWYTGPVGTLTHLSDYALVFSEWDDANADYQRHREGLPRGRRSGPSASPSKRSLNAYEGMEGRPS